MVLLLMPGWVWGVAAFCWILVLGLLGLLMLWWFRAVDFRLRAAVGW